MQWGYSIFTYTGAAEDEIDSLSTVDAVARLLFESVGQDLPKK